MRVEQAQNVASPTFSCVIRDRQGSIIATTDHVGNTLEKNMYDPYGVPMTTAAGESVTGRFGYTGQIWIPEIGLWHYKARFYSPTLGRFMQTDPIGYCSLCLVNEGEGFIDPPAAPLGSASTSGYRAGLSPLS